jgi:hypothetical protein
MPGKRSRRNGEAARALNTSIPQLVLCDRGLFPGSLQVQEEPRSETRETAKAGQEGRSESCGLAGRGWAVLCWHPVGFVPIVRCVVYHLSLLVKC